MMPIETNRPAYWDSVIAGFHHQAPNEIWRAYMRRVYGRLSESWLRPAGRNLCLKTDLFEEAISAHHPLTDLGPGAAGLDGSPAVARAARANLLRRGEPPRLVVGDLCAIPIASRSLPAILSGSSLDHFSDPDDLAQGLSELARILKPGGVLVITFDNPHNPLVWLRNRLPFRLLHRLGLVPYYVGVTYGLPQARRALAGLGLEVTHVSAVAHAPRVPAIWLSALANRLLWPSLVALLDRALDSCELLERLPTRWITGYYIALRAVAPLE